MTAREHLDAIKTREQAAHPDGGSVAAYWDRMCTSHADIPRLVAALEAVLAIGESRTVRAITDALAGGGS